MSVDELRKFHRAQPFQPFMVHIEGGRMIEVRDRDFLAISPSGRTFIVHHPPGESYSVVDLHLVKELKVIESKPKSKDGRKRRR